MFHSMVNYGLLFWNNTALYARYYKLREKKDIKNYVENKSMDFL
jgi:hypothetical protein